MKNHFLMPLVLLFSLSLYSQPKNKVDSVLLRNDSLWQYINGGQTLRGIVVKRQGIVADANRNIITGLEVVIDTRSENNFITADNARVTNSHNNILNAKNVIIENSSGCNINGADHTIKNSPYCEVSNDANWVENAESSNTKGTGNRNYMNAGIINGNNNRLGLANVQYYNSQITGDNNIIEGNRSKIFGNYIKIVGNDIIVIGSGSPNNILLFTTPGVHIVNEQASSRPITQKPFPGRYTAYTSTGQLLYLVKIE